MASVNKCVILGNLGRDVELRYLPSGDAIANMAVATSYKSKDKQTGEQKDHTEWHRIALFGRLAEIAGQYLKKGSSVYIEGRLQTRKYQKDGVDHYATEIVAENMQMLGGRAGAGEQDQGYEQPRQNSREEARNAQAAIARPPAPAARQQPRPAPNFSDMDQDIPF